MTHPIVGSYVEFEFNGAKVWGKVIGRSRRGTLIIDLHSGQQVMIPETNKTLREM